MCLINQCFSISLCFIQSFYRLQELNIARQVDKQSLQQAERRLTDERRLKQSIDAQLNNERKQRKQAEEKAAR